MRKTYKYYLPFILTFVIIVLDQVSKALVVKYIPEDTIGLSFFHNWLWIVHVRNDAVAFSIGSSFPLVAKVLLFIVLPLLIMAFVGYIIVSRKERGEVSMFQRWCLAGILGGGIGNLIDRVFRHLRVVDFISTDMNGFLGYERFPTWNIADGTVVVCVILLLISFAFRSDKKRLKREKDSRRKNG